MRTRSIEAAGFGRGSLLQLFGVAALLAGSAILSGAIVRLLQLNDEIPRKFVPWFEDVFRDDPAHGYQVMVGLIFSLVGVVVGVPLIIRGLANLRPMRGTTAGAPAFRSNDETAAVIRHKEIQPFRPAPSLGSYLFQGLSGGRLGFLPEAARSVFLENVRFLKTAVILLSIVIVVFFFDEYVFSAVDPPPDLPAATGLLLVIAVILAVKLAASGLVTPFTSPPLDSASERQDVTNAGDPATAVSRLKEALKRLAPSEGSVRCWQENLALSGGGIADRGTVKGSLLVETGAESAAPPKPLAGLLLLAAGAVLLPLGLLALIHLNVPADPFSSRATFVKATLPDALNKTAVFLLCAIYGGQFLNQASTLLSRMRFTSVTYLVDIEGAYGRAEMRVGKAVQDSIESDSVATSSDLSFTYYAAELLTESAQPDAPRYLDALSAPDHATLAFDSLRKEIDEFAARGIEIRGPAAATTELGRIARLNVELSARRRAALQETGRERLGPHTSPRDTEPTGQERRCPKCGEAAEAEARFCQSCGSELRQDRGLSGIERH